MNRQEFIETWIHDWALSCEDILRKKGGDYADHSDIFDNFRRHARTLDVNPELIWAVYASKHWDAIMTYVRTGKVQSEPILDRLRDLRNYVDLLAAHLSEKETK